MFEGLKKMWREAKKKVEESDDSVIKMNAICQNMHETVPIDISPPGYDKHIGAAIDTEIATLVTEMNRVGIVTACSCQGQDGGEAYISICLRDGTTYDHMKDVFGAGHDELILRWRRKP